MAVPVTTIDIEMDCHFCHVSNLNINADDTHENDTKSSLEMDMEVEANEIESNIQELESTTSTILSDEILDTVFKYIHHTDLANCRLVCKTFNQRSLKIMCEKMFWGLKSKPGELSRFHKTFCKDDLPLQKFKAIKLFLRNCLITDEHKHFMETFSMYVKRFHVEFSILDAWTSKEFPRDDWDENVIQSRLEKFICFEGLPICRVLSITNVPCRKFNGKFDRNINAHSNINEVAINHRCDDNEKEVETFNEDNYYAKLLKSCPNLTSLSITLHYQHSNSKTPDSLIDISKKIVSNMKRMIGCSKLRNLRVLSLSWNSNFHINVNLREILRTYSHSLISFKLHNLLDQNMSPTLQRVERLEELRMSFEQEPNFFKSFKPCFVKYFWLDHLKILQIPANLKVGKCNAAQFLLNTPFPFLRKPQKVILVGMDESTDKMFTIDLNPTDIISELKLEASCSVKCLSKCNESYMKTILNKFPNLEKLAIVGFNERRFWLGLIKSNITYTLASLSLCETNLEQSKNNLKLRSGLDHIHMDSRITGFSVSKCALLQKRIQKRRFDSVSFDSVELKEWKRVCNCVQNALNITQFPNLRKLKLVYFPLSGLTEVSVIFILMTMKNLASLIIKGTNFEEDFVRKIRTLIPLHLYMEIPTQVDIPAVSVYEK